MNTINETYINALLADAACVRLHEGDDTAAPNTPLRTGSALTTAIAGRMTQSQAEFITSNFEVLNQELSATGGFDATVWCGKAGTAYAGKVYVSMRGTQQSQDFVDDANLALSGIAYRQLESMANWWLRETTAINTSAKQIKFAYDTVPWSFEAAPSVMGTGSLASIGSIEQVNGHSLGGYMASAFTRLFGNGWNVGRTTTFNSAGFRSEFASQIETSFGQIQSLVGSSLGRSSFNTTAAQDNLFARNGVNVTTNDWNNPAGFTQYGQRTGLYQEDGLQSVFGVPNTDPFSNHYMFKQTDLLALGAAMEKLDSTMTFARLNDFIKAGSNVMAGSYEGVLDGLRRMLVAPGLGSIPVGDVSDSASTRVTYHQLLKQLTDNAFFKSLEGKVTVALTGANIGTQARARVGFEEIAALETLSPIVLSAAGAEGTAALESLWQSQVWDIKYQSWLADKASLQTGGAADAYTNEWIADRSAMLGKVIERNQKDIGGIVPGTQNLRYFDKASNTQVLVGAGSAQRTQYLFGGEGDDPLDGQGFADHLYGGDGIDTFDGNGGNDYLQGDAGDDNLNGGEGQDTLLGGTGDDKLDGGAGNDILKGGTGTDTYTLRASDSGIDTITDSDGLGSIQVITTDGSEITLGSSTLTKLASGPSNTGTWQSEDKRFTYTTRSEADGSSSLSISGGGVSTVVQNFSSGDLGITLPDAAPSEEDPTTARQILGDREAVDFNGAEEGIQGQPDELGNIIVDADQVKPNQADNLYDSADDDEIIAGGGNDRVQATRGGNNWIDAGGGHDTVYAGAGDDLIELGDGNDYGSGGAGDDRLFAGSQTPLDEILKQTVASAATETLDGGSGNDTLVGEAGHDTLYGGAGSDLMIGGAGEDRMHGDLGGLQDQPAGLQSAGQAGHTVSRIPLRRHQPAQRPGGRYASGRRNSPGAPNHHGVSAEPGAEGIGRGGEGAVRRMLCPGGAMNLVAACGHPIKARGLFCSKKTGIKLLAARTALGDLGCRIQLQPQTGERQAQGVRQTANIDQNIIARRQPSYTCNEGAFFYDTRKKANHDDPKGGNLIALIAPGTEEIFPCAA